MTELLRAASALLIEAGELDWGRFLARLAERSQEARGTGDRQIVVREVLALYGGMGSFQDLTPQDETGVFAEQGELERLKADLFAQARAELA